MALGMWGDGGRWGDGGKYNASILQLREYFAAIDGTSANSSNYTTNWCLQSDDGTFWIPQIGPNV
jgi:hypothetical protein